MALEAVLCSTEKSDSAGETAAVQNIAFAVVGIDGAPVERSLQEA